MSKSWVLVLLILVIYCVGAFAVVVDNGGQTPQAISQEQKLAELTANIQALNAKIDALPNEKKTQELLEKQLGVLQLMLSNFQTFLIVSFIVVLLCVLSLFYGVYFYFKSKGRI